MVPCLPIPRYGYREGASLFGLGLVIFAVRTAFLQPILIEFIGWPVLRGLKVRFIDDWAHDVVEDNAATCPKATTWPFGFRWRQDIRDWCAEARHADRLVCGPHALQHR